MNEFAAKKLGEVLAFTSVGTDTIERGRTALVEALGAVRIAELQEKNHMHGESVLRIATDAGVADTTLAKAQKTGDKLKAMRDMYVGDQWDNATELLEWSGFFEGAAIVHWGLVKGVAEALNNEDLLLLSQEAITWHYELLELAETELQAKGADKSTA